MAICPISALLCGVGLTGLGAAIGGLTYATVLTLLVVPSLYVMMSRKKIKKDEANNTNSTKEESVTDGEIASNQE